MGKRVNFYKYMHILTNFIKLVIHPKLSTLFQQHIKFQLKIFKSKSTLYWAKSSDK